MKRQIHAVRGHERVVVPGHDVKLGRGGIREIEFFVQTQQLIFGGRRPQMRGSRTLDMLASSHADDGSRAEAVEESDRRLSSSCAGSSTGCRWSPTSRRSGCRSSAPELARFAKFCGYARLELFATDLTCHLTQVENHYARLFEDAPTLAAAAGSLVFTGVADDPETLATLRRLGFQRSGSGGRDDPRLAFRPPRRGAQRRARARC